MTTIVEADAQAKERGVLGSLVVEGTKEADTEYDGASITVTTRSHVVTQQGRDRRPAKFDSLKVGQRVQARFTGAVLQSYPVQATASEIVILK